MAIQTNGQPQTPNRTADIDILGDFDALVGDLRGMLDTLQTRVGTLTNNLQVSAKVATQVATILNPEILLPEMVETVKESFSLYHAHVYLISEDGRTLQLAAGSGEAGKAMLANNHAIAFDAPRSAVALAARTKELVILNDVFSAEGYLPNPLLPHTRSEMAIPMIAGDRILGVLDLQHDEVDRFDEIDRQVKQTLADQVAVAIDNAAAFAEVQEVRRELLLSNQAIEASFTGISIADARAEDMPLTYVNPAFTRITGYEEYEVIGRNCRFLQGDDRDQEDLRKLRYALREGHNTTVVLRNYRKDGTLFWNELSISPLYNRDGELTHFVAVQTDITDRKQAEQREALAYELGQQLNQVQETEPLLQNAVDRLSATFAYYHTHVYLFNTRRNRLTVAAGTGEAGRNMKAARHSIDYFSEKSLVARAARSLQPVIAQNVLDDSEHLPNPLLPRTRSEAALPLFVGNELLGVLDVQSDAVNHFSDEEVRTLTIIATQLATALSNVLQLEATQQRVRDLNVANRAAQYINRVDDDLVTMLENVFNVVLEALEPDNIVFTEYDEDENMWYGLTGVGEGITIDFIRSVVEPFDFAPHATEAITENRVVTVDTAATYPGFPKEYIESIGIKSVAVMPVVGRNEKIGVAYLNYNRIQHFFSEEEVNLLQTVSYQIATGVEAKRQEARIQQRVKELGVNSDIAEIITQADTDLFTLLEETLEVIRTAFEADIIVLDRYDEADDYWYGVVGTGPQITQEFVDGIADPGHLYPHGIEALRTLNVIPVNDAKTYPGFPQHYVEQFGIKSAAAIPVGSREGGTIGVAFLTFTSKPYTFTEDDFRLLRSASRQIAIGVTNKQLEQETREREEYYRNLIEGSSDITTIIDGEGIIQYVSPSFERYLGYDIVDVTGTHILDYILADDVPLIMGRIQRLAAANVEDTRIINPEPTRFRMRHVEGDIRTFDGIDRSEMHNPAIQGIIINFRDVTVNIAFEQELTLRNSAIEASLTSIAIADASQPDAPLVYVNQAFTDLTGYELGEALGRNCRFLQGDDRDQEGRHELGAAIREGRQTQVTLRNYRKNGVMFYNQVALSPITNARGEVTHFVAASVDVTEPILREREQAAAARRNEIIADIVEDLTAASNEDEILRAVAEPFESYGFGMATLTYMVTTENEDRPEIHRTVSVRSGDGQQLPLSVLPQVEVDATANPIAQLVYDNPDDIIYIEDRDNDPRLGEANAELLRQSGIAAITPIPLRSGRQWHGMVTFTWPEPHEFERDLVIIIEEVQETIASVVASRRSFIAEEQAHRESERRARQLETVAQVTTNTTTVMNVEDLLTNFVELTKERFDLYHAHVYLLDEDGEVLNLAAGAGEAGEVMLKHDHSITVDHRTSIVAKAARERTGVLVQDVNKSASFMPNPLLPHTASEIAVPLIVRGELLGVLDIQSDEAYKLTEEDVQIQSTLASQIAVGIANARTFSQVQSSARQLETVAEVSAATTTVMDVDELLTNFVELTKLRFDLYHAHVYLLDAEGEMLFLAAGAGEAGKVMLKHHHSISVDHTSSVVAKAARERQGVLVQDVGASPTFMPNPLLPYTASEIAVPLIARGSLIGVLDIQSDEAYRLTKEDVRIQITLASQIAVAIENARTFELVQSSTRQLATVAEVSAATTTLLDVRELLTAVVELTKSRFDLYHAHVYLLNEDQTLLILAAGAGEAGATMLKHNHTIAINHPNAIVAKAARERQGILVRDVTDSPAFMPNPLLPYTESEIAVPLIIANELIGVLDVQADEAGRFNEEDVQIQSTLASQIAVAVQNARAFAETEAVAERERAAAERAREAERLKSQFLASMSHELRTPLNSIIGYSEVLLDGGDGDLSEDATEDVQIIYDSGKHLLAIINDILDLAKIEAGQMRLSYQPTNVVSILETAVKQNQIIVKNRPVDLLLESEIPEIIAEIDELRMRQIVLNLLSNALKFTEEGSVTVRTYMHDADTAIIEVEDTGIGISPEGQKIVFDQFRQVDGSTTRKVGGTGLGLTITRYLIQMHGGEVDLESEVGVGTRFWFTLPLKHVDQELNILPA